MNKIESALVSNEFICREIERQATIIRRIEQEIRKMRINPDRTVESWAVNLEKCLKRQKEILSAYSELYCRRMEKTETFVNPLTVAYCPPQPVQITKLSICVCHVLDFSIILGSDGSKPTEAKLLYISVLSDSNIVFIAVDCKNADTRASFILSLKFFLKVE